MRKKVALISLLLLVVFSISAVANAAVFASKYITDYFAKTAVSSNGRVTVSFDINATDTMNVLGAKTVIFQELAPAATSWTAVATLSSNDYPEMLGYNVSMHGADLYYYGAKSGYSYRAKVYFYAENGGYDVREYITASAK